MPATRKVKLLSWNVQRPGRGRIREVVDAIASLEADILTLQEANQRVAEQLVDLGYEHQVSQFTHEYAHHDKWNVPTHGALIASKFELEPDIAWTEEACYPVLFARARVDTPIEEIDVVTAHIPNGSSNGWRKAHHLRALGQMLRESQPASRVLTGDFNEPRDILADGRVVGFGADIRSSGSLNVEGQERKGTEGLTGPFPYREWDRAVADLFAPTYHGLEHFLMRTRKSLRPKPVTHETRKSPRFFDHAFVSVDLKVTGRYLHELRTSKVSDHSAILLNISRRARTGEPEWDFEQSI